MDICYIYYGAICYIYYECFDIYQIFVTYLLIIPIFLSYFFVNPLFEIAPL